MVFRVSIIQLVDDDVFFLFENDVMCRHIKYICFRLWVEVFDFGFAICFARLFF